MLQLQKLQALRTSFVQGRTSADPLDAYCPFTREQSNPNRDTMPGGAIKSDVNDALYLLYAVVLKYRFLANVSSSCVPLPLSASPDFRLTAQVVGGSGQGLGSVAGGSGRHRYGRKLVPKDGSALSGLGGVGTERRSAAEIVYGAAGIPERRVALNSQTFSQRLTTAIMR